MEHRVERLDLIQQAVGQFLAGDDRQGGNVIDRLFRIKFGALAAGLAEDVDHMGLDIEQAEFEHSEQPDRAGTDNERVGFDHGAFYWRVSDVGHDA